MTTNRSLWRPVDVWGQQSLPNYLYSGYSASRGYTPHTDYSPAGAALSNPLHEKGIVGRTWKQANNELFVGRNDFPAKSSQAAFDGTPTILILFLATGGPHREATWLEKKTHSATKNWIFVSFRGETCNLGHFMLIGFPTRLNAAPSR